MTAASAALADLLAREREALLAAWRQQVRKLPSARDLDVPTLNDHVPRLLDELVEALRAAPPDVTDDSIDRGPPAAHGAQRVEDGYDIEEVVSEYNLLRGCIHDLAEAHALALEGDPFRTLNAVFDSAIAVAVKTFAVQRALDVQQRREEYLAFLAHDLRTPLNAISLAARALEQCAPGDTAMTRMIAVLRRNVHQLAALVDSVLKENSRYIPEGEGHLQRRSFDLWPLVEGLLGDLQPLAETAGTRLVNAVPEDITVHADASLLRRVFQNLVANAIAHATGGTVTVCARPLDDSGAIECEVHDDGVGIAPERLDKVFEPAETDADKASGSGEDDAGTPALGSGLGLGLAIVKTFIEAHGGTVSVESREGKGTMLRMRLPGPPREAG